MTWFRTDSRLMSGSSTTGARTQPPLEERRRSIRSTVLGTGTLACYRCDAPIALGSGRAALSDRLSCPFCAARGPLRDFLSLAAPTRPARVLVRVQRV